MAGARLIPIAILLGVFVTAHFALAWQAEKNGTFTLASIFEFNTRTLPNTNVPITLPQTGIKQVDNYFAFMMSFFWMALDSRNIRAHLQANYLLGTLSGAWILMLTEAHRTTTSTTFLVLTYFFELMGEALGIGLFTPLWCAVHLFWTKAPSANSKHDAEDSLAAPSGSLRALGWAIALGHLGPTLIMRDTKLDGEGLYSQQLWTILRLFHPVFVLTFFVLFKTILGSGKHEAPARRLADKRKLYLFAILASAYGHMSTFAVLFAQTWIPDWLRPEVLKALGDKAILVPVAFWSQSPVKQVPFLTGVATFLQWDNICSASAIFIWASSLYMEALRGHPAGFKLSAVFNMAVQTAGVVLLAGPVAGGAYFLLERDALVVAHHREKESKKN